MADAERTRPHLGSQIMLVFVGVDAESTATAGAVWDLGEGGFRFRLPEADKSALLGGTPVYVVRIDFSFLSVADWV